MAAATKDYIIEKEAAFKPRLIWLDRNFKPIDLTGWSAKLQVRETIAGSVVLEASTTNGRIVLGTVNGVIQIDVPVDVVNALTFTQGIYDLRLTNALAVPIRFIEGRITVSPGVTQG
jgi:DUF4097 and DUF4098 domain-containing protein YvlB